MTYIYGAKWNWAHVNFTLQNSNGHVAHRRTLCYTHITMQSELISVIVKSFRFDSIWFACISFFSCTYAMVYRHFRFTVRMYIYNLYIRDFLFSFQFYQFICISFYKFSLPRPYPCPSSNPIESNIKANVHVIQHFHRSTDPFRLCRYMSYVCRTSYSYTFAPTGITNGNEYLTDCLISLNIDRIIIMY